VPNPSTRYWVLTQHLLGMRTCIIGSACAHPKMGWSMLFGPIHLCLVWAQTAMLEPILLEFQLYIGLDLSGPSLRGVF